jgi:hypothetical protein
VQTERSGRRSQSLFKDKNKFSYYPLGLFCESAKSVKKGQLYFAKCRFYRCFRGVKQFFAFFDESAKIKLI